MTTQDWFSEGIESIINNTTKLSNAWHDEGEDLYAQGKYAEAVQAYDKAIELNPNDTLALAGRDKASVKAKEERSSNDSKAWGRQDPNDVLKRSKNFIIGPSQPRHSITVFDIYDELMFEPVLNESNKTVYFAVAEGIAVKGMAKVYFATEKPIYFAGGFDDKSIPAPDGSTNRSFIIMKLDRSKPPNEQEPIGVIRVNDYPDHLPKSYNISQKVIDTFYQDKSLYHSPDFHLYMKLVTLPKYQKQCAIGFGWVPSRGDVVYIANYQHDLNTTVTIIIIGVDNQQLFNDILSTFELHIIKEQLVRISGSASALPAIKGLADDFNYGSPLYRIVVSGGGSAKGLEDVSTGVSDIAMTYGPLSPDDTKKYGRNFTGHQFATDAVAIIVSKSVYDSGVTQLTRQQVKDIYNGDITDWNDITRTTGKPAKSIYVVGRDLESDTKRFFNQIIFDDPIAENPGVEVMKTSNEEVATAVGHTDNGIGYVSFSYANATGIKVVALEGILPTATTVSDGSYPLVIPLYVYTFPKPDTKQGTLDFLSYIQSVYGGQEKLEPLGFFRIT